jgi:integrase
MHEDGEPACLATYLLGWLERRVGRVQPVTLDGYRRVIHRHLIPHLGHHRLDELSPRLLTACYADLARHGRHDGGPLAVGPIHAVLRAAQQTTAFFHGVADHPLRPLWTIAALSGLPSRELLALSWNDVDLDTRLLHPRWALSANRRQLARRPARSYRGAVPIDDVAADALIAQRRAQQRWQAEQGVLWHHTWDLVFTRRTGRPLHPQVMSDTFRDTTDRLGLPRVTLSGLPSCPVDAVHAALRTTPQPELRAPAADDTAPRDDDPARTVGDYLDRWLARHTPRLRRTTAYLYGQIIHRDLRPVVGHLLLTDLSPAVLTSAFTDMTLRGGPDGRPVSLRMVRGAFDLLRNAIADAVDDGLLPTDPCAAAIIPRRHPDPPPRTRPQPTVWTAEQLVAFFAATAGRPLAALWVVAACTGMRRGELLGLSWDDVDLTRRTIRLQRSLTVLHGDIELGPTKTARPRTLAFDERTFTALSSQQRQQERWKHDAGPWWHNPWNLVFTTERGHPLQPNGVSRTFKREVQRAGLPHATVHTLRHVHATLLLQAGVPVKVVSERLGHARARQTLDTYIHVLPAMDAAAAEQLAALMQRTDDAM